MHSPPRQPTRREGEVTDFPEVGRVVVRSEDCPECHQLCGWCSWYRWLARERGCGSQPYGRRQHRCEKATALKGTKCGTCDGSRKVLVRREILQEAGRAALAENTGGA
jgi:hypothetical protein